MAPVRKLLTFGLDTEEGLHFMVTQQIQIWLPCQTLGLQETNLTASESVFKQWVNHRHIIINNNNNNNSMKQEPLYSLRVPLELIVLRRFSLLWRHTVSLRSGYRRFHGSSSLHIQGQAVGVNWLPGHVEHGAILSVSRTAGLTWHLSLHTWCQLRVMAVVMQQYTGTDVPTLRSALQPPALAITPVTLRVLTVTSQCPSAVKT